MHNTVLLVTDPMLFSSPELISCNWNLTPTSHPTPQPMATTTPLLLLGVWLFWITSHVSGIVQWKTVCRLLKKWKMDILFFNPGHDPLYWCQDPLMWCYHSLNYIARGPELFFALEQTVKSLKLVSKTCEVGRKSWGEEDKKRDLKN